MYMMPPFVRQTLMNFLIKIIKIIKHSNNISSCFLHKNPIHSFIKHSAQVNWIGIFKNTVYPINCLRIGTWRALFAHLLLVLLWNGPLGFWIRALVHVIYKGYMYVVCLPRLAFTPCTDVTHLKFKQNQHSLSNLDHLSRTFIWVMFTVRQIIVSPTSVCLQSSTTFC
jgi:hypothetical protein